MLNKQGFNGNLGETRTAALLAKDFLVSTISVDIAGADFIVEIMPSSLDEIQESKKKIACKGIIQAKYFEYSNEVKIARHYVEDMEGVKTDFFALIHTDDLDEIAHVYFFTAYEIQKEFILRTDDSKDYYIFRLSSKNNFSNYKDIPNNKINQKIKTEISRTAEFRNEEFIRRIREKWTNPINANRHSNTALFDSIKNKHIVDKLYDVLATYNDLRRVHAWRLADKMAFPNTINTHTYYRQFALYTNNQQIIDFFSNIKINKTAEIKNLSFFKGVKNVKHKIDFIISKLNENNINSLQHGNKTLDISVEHDEICDCSVCRYRNLNFCESELAADPKDTINSWDLLQSCFTLFNLGKYEIAKSLCQQALSNAQANKEQIVTFICKYNLNVIGQYIWDENSFDLYSELLRLDISSEKKDILKYVSENTLLNGYLKNIDDNYLKIKDYQQRQLNNSTLDLINNQRTKIIECLEFYRGNRFLLTDDFDVLFEKHIECCIISFSMNCSYRRHLNNFDDFIIESIFLYCDPQKLVTYFQRNNVKLIPYDIKIENYLNDALDAFYSHENIDYLKNEIRIVQGKFKNYELRKKASRIFSNSCILLSFLDVQIEEPLIRKILNFIKELDFEADSYSFLAFPILNKTDSFSTAQLMRLVRILLTKNENRGYLLSNCLFALEIKGYKIADDEKDIIEPISNTILVESNFHILRSFPKLLDGKDLEILACSIDQSLQIEFNTELFHEAVINECLFDYSKFSAMYSAEVIASLKRKNPIMRDNSSTLTGLSYASASKLNKLIELVYTVGEDIINKETVEFVREIHPYYNFLIQIETMDNADSFEISWLAEISSAIILKKLGGSEIVRTKIKQLVTNDMSKNLLKIYFEYFTDN